MSQKKPFVQRGEIYNFKNDNDHERYCRSQKAYAKKAGWPGILLPGTMKKWEVMSLTNAQKKKVKEYVKEQTKLRDDAIKDRTLKWPIEKGNTPDIDELDDLIKNLEILDFPKHFTSKL